MAQDSAPWWGFSQHPGTRTWVGPAAHCLPDPWCPWPSLGYGLQGQQGRGHRAAGHRVSGGVAAGLQVTGSVGVWLCLLPPWLLTPIRAGEETQVPPSQAGTAGTADPQARGSPTAGPTSAGLSSPTLSSPVPSPADACLCRAHSVVLGATGKRVCGLTMLRCALRGSPGSGEGSSAPSERGQSHCITWCD